MATQILPHYDEYSALAKILAQLPKAISLSLPCQANRQPSLSLAQSLQAKGFQQLACQVLTLLVANEPDNIQALYQLALTHNRAGNQQAATKYMTLHYAKIMQQNGLPPETNQATLNYLLSTEGYGEAPKHIPQAYIENLFDRFSTHFDTRLINKLTYKAPQLLYNLVRQCIPNQEDLPVFNHIVDLGCGTGLAGQYFKSLGKKLTGVDLSKKMLEQAEKTALYDNLVASEISAFLNSDMALVDAFIATDVLIYFSDLLPLFTACKKHQQVGGMLAFSLEALPKVQAQKHAVKLASSGRFQHQKQHVIKLANQAHYEVQVCSENVIRHEDGRDVIGYLFVLLAQHINPKAKR